MLRLFCLNTEAIKSKSVNLALETVLEFNHKDNAVDTKFLDNVQQFLDKVKNVVGTNRTARRFETKNTNIKFIDFIKTAIDILKTYDDDDLEDVFAVFDDEIRKYHYRGCKFYELVEDRNVRRFVANKLDKVKDTSAVKLRQSLDYVVEAIENSVHNTKQVEFVDYINSLYSEDSNAKLKTFLDNLKTYSSKSKRSNLDLIKVVRDGIRSVVFDHYSALNANARRDLKIKLETRWKSINPERDEHSIWTAKYKSSKLKTKKYNDHIDIKITTAHPVKTNEANTESISTEPNSDTRAHQKQRAKKRIDKAVYFNKHKKNNKVFKSTESTRQKQSKNNTKARVRPKHRHIRKKLSTFITLYPEEITFKTKTLQEDETAATTRKARLYTLWEESIKQKKQRGIKNIKRKAIKTRSDVEVKDKPKVISESETVINVNRAVLSSKEEGGPEFGKEHITDSETKPTKKHHKWRKTKTTEAKYKPTTVKLKKYKATTESGLAIDSYEIKRRSMVNTNTSANQLKINVLRRINNLEKEMEKVKSKIETKLTTVLIDNLIRETFRPLEFWGATTRDTINSTKNKSSTEPSTDAENTSTTETTKTNAVAKQINKTENAEITNANNIAEYVTEINKNDSVIEEKHKLAGVTDNNKVNKNLDNETNINNIMQKYNLSINPDQKETFDLDKVLEESPQLESKNDVKEIIENDLKKVMEEKTMTSGAKVISNLLQDIMDI